MSDPFSGKKSAAADIDRVVKDAMSRVEDGESRRSVFRDAKKKLIKIQNSISLHGGNLSVTRNVLKELEKRLDEGED